MTNNNEELETRLAFDALNAAEKITGRSINDGDRPAGEIASMLLQENEDRKRELLLINNDTTFFDTLEHFTAVILDMGFDLALREDFISDSSLDGRNKGQESFYIYAHRDGMLLAFDTFWGDKMNGGHLYYNWVPNSVNDRSGAAGIGSFKEHPEGVEFDGRRLIWVGDHDCREALRLKVNRLRKHGRFMPKWGKAPFLWLMHHQDIKAKDYDYEALNKARIAKLPEWVQEMIGEV